MTILSDLCNSVIEQIQVAHEITSPHVQLSQPPHALVAKQSPSEYKAVKHVPYMTFLTFTFVHFLLHMLRFFFLKNPAVEKLAEQIPFVQLGDEVKPLRHQELLGQGLR
jgi:hypothetical protein